MCQNNAGFTKVILGFNLHNLTAPKLKGFTVAGEWATAAMVATTVRETGAEREGDDEMKRGSRAEYHDGAGDISGRC